MASDDVIELGSSDEDTEPAPKRKKPPPNAMVHIPDKLLSKATPSKNAKSRINPACIIKGSLGQAVTVTKITKSNINPYADKKLNGSPMKGQIQIKSVTGAKRGVQIPVLKNATVPGTGLTIANGSKLINPFGNVQKHFNKNTPCQGGSNNLNLVKLMKPVPGKMPGQKKPISLTNTCLPPGITIKKTTAPKANNKSKINIKNLNSPLTLLRISNVRELAQTPSCGAMYGALSSAEVPTVNLDDDEPVASSSGPQWYLRPEDQNKSMTEKTDELLDPSADTSSHDDIKNDTEKEISVEKSQEISSEKLLSASEPSSLEKQNNKEPDKSTFIEITIDDSPAKPKPKMGFKVGAELAITIEDSPIKNSMDKDGPGDSDVEDEPSKDRNSKKKLEYPKTVEIEIEFQPQTVEESTSEMKSASPNELESNKTSPAKPLTKESPNSDTNADPSISENKSEKPKKIYECMDVVEIEESPIKPIEEVKVTTPKKIKPTKPQYKMTQIETIDLDDKDKDEFTPTYQRFINLCFQLENSEDMKKIVEKKIKGYYLQVSKDYTESEMFTDLVSDKMMAMKAGPEKMYLYIKDIVDELNLQRKMAKAQPVKEKEEQQKFLYGEDSEFDAKRQRQIRKLEKTLKKLHRAIQKLEEQEVDFDDEEDSVYLLTESEGDTSAKDGKPLNKEALLQRYKERSVRVHAKLCQLTNTKMPSEARVLIEPRPGQPKGPARRLDKWVNRKVPIGTPVPFPDFHDVLRCVREANQEDKLGWNEADIVEEARDLFVRCGKKLQRRRQENEWRLAASRIPADTADPAEDSTELKRKLEENRRVAAKKETDVFNKYADRQNQLKLEAVEIGDKEAEESPVESDDEDVAEVTESLTNTERRKERLKRLLHEKSKVSEDKGCQPDNLLPESENSKKDATKDSTEDGSSTDNNKENPKTYPVEADVKEHSNSDSTNKDEINAVNSDTSSKSKCDSNKIDSDIDELHLLEKLYSENEYNKGSSDTSSPIAISDTSSTNEQMSGDEGRTKKPSSDIISIENSSYSESEEKADSSKDTETENTNKAVEETTDVNMKLHCSVDKTINKTNHEKCNEILEDILLASSDEGGDTESCKHNSANITCVNSADDNISIGDTLIIDNRDIDVDCEASKAENSDKIAIADGSSVEGIEIEHIKINSEGQSRHDTIIENPNVESLKEGNTSKIENTKSPEANRKITLPEMEKSDSVETIGDKNANAENVNVTTCVISTENNNNGNNNEIIISTVQSRDNQNLNEVCENSVKAVESETTIESIVDVSMEEILHDVMNTVDTTDKGNEATTEKETKENNTTKDESKTDSSIQSSEDTPMNELKDDIHTTNNTEIPSESVTENNSMSEAMEVDSIDQNL